MLKPENTSYERLQAATDAAGVGTWDFNPLTGELQWSARCKELFGVPQEEEVDYPRFLAGLHPDDRARTDVVVQQALDPRGTGEYDIEYRTVAENTGEVHWVRATGRAYFDEARTQAVRFLGTIVDVSDAKRRDEEYRFIVEFIPQMVWLTDPQGYHAFFNQRWIDYTGYTVEQSQGTEMWNNLLHPDDRARARQVWGHALATGDDYEIEYRIKGKDGTYRWFLGLAKPMRSTEGEIIQWFGTCTDIQEQKENEEALRWSEERYGLASLATNDAIWDWNLQTNAVTWNDAIHREFGYAADAVENTAKWWYDHIHPEDAERVVHGIHAVIDGEGTAWHDEYRYRRADGSYAQVLDRGHVARDTEGKPMRMIGAMQDVTEQRRAGEALREREAEFTSLADNMAQLAWMTRPDGHIYWYNQRWYDFTGTTPQEMEGWGWSKVHHPEHLQRVTERWKRQLAAGEPWEDTFPLRGKDGEYRWFLSRAVPVRDAAGQVVRWLGTNTDITEQKQLQEQLERAYADLEAKVMFRTLDLEHQVQELQRKLAEAKG
ncbi:PAS domain S-box protein [Hymenobacter gummosus]|uniref:histidine kinase n=1 Tax=Hymenobacter gummosus TaxID=1776032 RepID=A0A431TVI0_9BACT|nr:PAS domain-containing protein [Hymenobacter gummosus]RTQ45286.1 PAS domain S-box protein [Hymenobacter gummosus]